MKGIVTVQCDDKLFADIQFWFTSFRSRESVGAKMVKREIEGELH